MLVVIAVIWQKCVVKTARLKL